MNSDDGSSVKGLTATLAFHATGNSGANVVVENPARVVNLSAVESAVNLQVDLLQNSAYWHVSAEATPTY